MFRSLSICGVLLFAYVDLSAQETSLTPLTVSQFEPFTGKVAKNKVRLRVGPHLDAPIARELNKGDMLLITGEVDEFYVVQPPADLKGYIFRTYVLDNKIESNRVNVRLSPNTEAPVIAQLNVGDTVEGTISALNSKWLEIALPTHAQCYVSKEYVEKVGDRHFMTRFNKRQEEVNTLLQSTYAISQEELRKPFPEIHLDRIVANYQKISHEYADFPDQAARAKEFLTQLQDNYLHKKIAYLEAKAENQVAQNASDAAKGTPSAFTVTPTLKPIGVTKDWAPVEQALFEAWATTHSGTREDFYLDQQRAAKSLRGVIEPYARAIKNRPGDFLLVDRATQLPIGFIYSTKVNLQQMVGQEVAVEVVERSNNHFAYPAYFVLSVE